MLGEVQKNLFKHALFDSKAKFKFVINGLPIQQLYILPYDRWEGYGAERSEILNFIGDNDIKNVIFLTTDFHASLVNQVFIDRFADPESIAVELVTGPIATDTLQQATKDPWTKRTLRRIPGTVTKGRIMPHTITVQRANRTLRRIPTITPLTPTTRTRILGTLTMAHCPHTAWNSWMSTSSIQHA